MKLIGYSTRLAFEIGAYAPESKQVQHISIWAGGKKINPIDDTVYLPAFYTKLCDEIRKLESNDLTRPALFSLSSNVAFQQLESEETWLHQVLNFDISTCAATCYFFEDAYCGRLLWSYWDSRHHPPEELGAVFSVDISKEEFIRVLTETRSNLSDVWV